MKKSGLQIAALCGSILFLVYTTPAQNRQVFPDADSAHSKTPGGNFLIGADYLRWLTNYNNLRRGLDNRLNIFFQYNF